MPPLNSCVSHVRKTWDLYPLSLETNGNTSFNGFFRYASSIKPFCLSLLVFALSLWVVQSCKFKRKRNIATQSSESGAIHLFPQSSKVPHRTYMYSVSTLSPITYHCCPCYWKLNYDVRYNLHIVAAKLCTEELFSTLIWLFEFLMAAVNILPTSVETLHGEK